MLYKQIQDQFSEEVEKIAEKSGSYIDAVLQLCDKHNIEPQVAAKIISRPIKEKIESEGRDSNLLPSVTKLPF
tara:strand:+ start:1234 stop:1452 length:219 start_codon:yes stop_codon:yes gene_type:complete